MEDEKAIIEKSTDYNSIVDNCVGNVISETAVMPKKYTQQEIDIIAEALRTKEEFTIAEIQTIARVSRQTVYNWMDKGLKSFKKSGMLFFKKEHITAYFDDLLQVTNLENEPRRTVNVRLAFYNIISGEAKKRRWSMTKMVDHIVSAGLRILDNNESKEKE
ncbi:MAG: helix-turn-helix domain-containing protein [Candidatus Neomarinimicrobiota bacterium]